MNHRQKKIPFDEGNKGHITNKIANDETLSCEAFRLLFLLLNNASTWEVNLGYYSRKFGWTERKQSKIRKELEDKGYLIMKGTGKGRGNGKEYIFTISEYGDLKGQPSTPQVPETPPTDPIQQHPEPAPEIRAVVHQRFMPTEPSPEELNTFELQLMKLDIPEKQWSLFIQAYRDEYEIKTPSMMVEFIKEKIEEMN